MVAILAGHFHERGQVGRIVSWPVPVRMIERIIGFGAELDARRFANPEILEQPDIVVLESRIVDQVANAVLVVKRALGRLGPL